jgi:hypothetical protein
MSEMKLLLWQRKPGFYWFRIFERRGLLLKDTTRYPMLFSERNGFTPHIKLGRWLIRPLGRS